MDSTDSRITKTLRYLYEYDKVVLEVDENGSEVARNVYGTNLISREVDGMKLTYLYNGHADVTALMDTSGVPVWYYDYDAYCSEYFDNETGSIYLSNRYYNPSTGRFLTEDPIRDGTNWYIYCYNNPINLFDPWGLKPGDRFLDPDEVAMDFNFYLVDEKGWIGQWEYGSAMYSWVEDGVTYYSYNEPHTDKNSIVVNISRTTPNGTKYYGTIHSHPEQTFPAFSSGNGVNGSDEQNQEKGTHMYLVTPSGTLIHKYKDEKGNFTKDRIVSDNMPVVMNTTATGTGKFPLTYIRKLSERGMIGKHKDYDDLVEQERKSVIQANLGAIQVSQIMRAESARMPGFWRSTRIYIEQ